MMQDMLKTNRQSLDARSTQHDYFNTFSKSRYGKDKLNSSILDNYPTIGSSTYNNPPPPRNSSNLSNLNRSHYDAEAVHTAQMLNDYLVLATRKQ